MVVVKKKPRDAVAAYPWPLKLDQGDVQRYLKMREGIRARMQSNRVKVDSEKVRR